MKTLMVAAIVALGMLFAVMPVGAKTVSKAAQLAQARVDAAAKAYAAVEAEFQVGRGRAETVYLWSVRWLDAQREQPLKGKALKVAVDEHLGRMVALEAAVAKQVSAGTASQTDLLGASYYLHEAEFWSDRGK